MKQLNEVVKKFLTTVNSCQSAVKLDPQNLLDYTTLFHTKRYKTWHKIELSAPKKNLLSTKPT